MNKNVIKEFVKYVTVDYKKMVLELAKEVNVLQEKILEGAPTGHFSEIVNRMDKIING